MTIRSVSDVINDAVTSIIAKQPATTTSANRSGSVIRDIVIETPASEFGTVYEDQDTIKKVQSVNYAADLTEAELDDLAANYDLTRLEGTAATGLITLIARNFGSPADGYTDITIPTGTEVSAPATTTRARINFTTTATVTMLAANYGVYYNTTTGFFEIQAPIEATTSGADTNIASGEINEIISVPSQINDVINNVASTGGTDPESNEDLAIRIKAKLKGNNKGTKSGYETTINDNTGVEDSITIGPNDTEMERNQFGGSVDILIVGEELVAQTDEYLFIGEYEFLFTNQPFRTLISVVATPAGLTQRTLLPSEYEVLADTGVFRGSSQAQNELKINIALELDTAVYAQFTYNKLIIDLQDTIDLDENHIIASDILIREATQLVLDIDFDIEIFSGYDLQSVISDIKSYITTQILNTGLEAEIDKSDVVSWCTEASDGVDSVDLDSIVFTVDGVVVSGGSVIAAKTEYIRLQTILINGF